MANSSGDQNPAKSESKPLNVEMIAAAKLRIDDPTRLERDQKHVDELVQDYQRWLRDHPDENPIQTPLRVIREAEGYLVLAGAYRLLAWLRLKSMSPELIHSDSLPCIVVLGLLDRAGRAIEQFRDNNLHHPYTPMEKGNSLLFVMNERKVLQGKAADLLGIRRPEAAKLMKVLDKYPQDLHQFIGVGDGMVPISMAYLLTSFHPDVDRIRALTEKTRKGFLIREDLEELIKQERTKERAGSVPSRTIRAKDAVAKIRGGVASAKALVAEVNKWIRSAGTP